MNARDAAGENRGRRGGQLRRGELAFPRPQHGQGDGVRHVQMFFFSRRIRPTRSTRDWSSDVCSSDLPADGVADALDSLEARDLIRHEPASWIEGEEQFTFKHALIREVAYATVSRARRRELHAKVRSEERRVGNACRCRWSPPG